MIEHAEVSATIVAIISYLLGSIPFGLLVGKVAGIGDLRKSGSGNFGATNMVRVGGKKLGLLTLVLDGGKGALAILLVRLFAGGDDIAVLLAAFCVVVGHVFPVWLKFRGGKGVATTLAVYLAISWPVGVLVCATWLVVFFLFRISSLSAIIAVSVAPLWIFVQGGSVDMIMLAVILALLVIAKHRTNIERLLKGQEGAFKK